MSEEQYWQDVRSGKNKAYNDDADFQRTMKDVTPPDWVKQKDAWGVEFWMVTEHEKFLKKKIIDSLKAFAKTMRDKKRAPPARTPAARKKKWSL